MTILEPARWLLGPPPAADLAGQLKLLLPVRPSPQDLLDSLHAAEAAWDVGPLVPAVDREVHRAALRLLLGQVFSARPRPADREDLRRLCLAWATAARLTDLVYPAGLCTPVHNPSAVLLDRDLLRWRARRSDPAPAWCLLKVNADPLDDDAYDRLVDENTDPYDTVFCLPTGPCPGFLKGLVAKAWDHVRHLVPDEVWPEEPPVVPDTGAARSALDRLGAWCLGRATLPSRVRTFEACHPTLWRGLSNLECRLVEALWDADAGAPGCEVSNDDLIDKLYGGEDGNENALKKVKQRLRDKLRPHFGLYDHGGGCGLRFFPSGSPSAR